MIDNWNGQSAALVLEERSFGLSFLEGAKNRWRRAATLHDREQITNLRPNGLELMFDRLLAGWPFVHHGLHGGGESRRHISDRLRPDKFRTQSGEQGSFRIVRASRDAVRTTGSSVLCVPRAAEVPVRAGLSNVARDDGDGILRIRRTSRTR